MLFSYFWVNAGVRTSTPPAAPRSPKSSGRRTIPTIRNRNRGPSGCLRPFGTRALTKRRDLLRGVRLPVEMIAHSEVQLRRERLTDRDLVGRARIDGTTRDDPSAIHDGAEASIEGSGDRLAAGARGNMIALRTQGREGLDTRDAAETRAAAQAVASPTVSSRSRSPAGRVEPRERGLRTARARNRRQHDRTDHPDQQRQHDDAPPAPPDLEPREHPHRTHVNRPQPTPPRASTEMSVRTPARKPRRSPLPLDAYPRHVARVDTLPKLGR